MLPIGPSPKKPPDEPPVVLPNDFWHTRAIQVQFEGKGQRGKGEPVTEQKANDRQVGGDHYKNGTGFQHWDLVNIYGWDYFQGQIIKYLMRWRKKNGIEDLQKARHYLDKYIELEVAKRDSAANASRGSIPAGNVSTKSD